MTEYGHHHLLWMLAENVWRIIKQLMWNYVETLTTLEDIVAATRRKWDAIDQVEIDNLVVNLFWSRHEFFFSCINYVTLWINRFFCKLTGHSWTSIHEWPSLLMNSWLDQLPLLKRCIVLHLPGSSCIYLHLPAVPAPTCRACISRLIGVSYLGISFLYRKKNLHSQTVRWNLLWV